MNTFGLLMAIREALQGQADVERVETLAQNEAREQREYGESLSADPEFKQLAPFPRSKRSPVPEDVLIITCKDEGTFIVRVTRLSDPPRPEFEEGDPPWQRKGV